MYKLGDVVWVEFDNALPQNSDSSSGLFFVDHVDVAKVDSMAGEWPVSIVGYFNTSLEDYCKLYEIKIRATDALIKSKLLKLIYEITF